MTNLTQSDIDWGGMTPHFNDIYYGATGQGQVGTKLDSSLITSLQQPGQVAFTMTGLNFNTTAPADIGHVNIVLPTGFTRWLLNGIYISNASHTLASASITFYTAAAQGGTALTGAITPTVTSSSDATNNNAMSCTITDANTRSYAVATETAVYANLGTAEGAAATADITVVITPLP